MSKSYGLKLHFTQLYTKIKELLFSTFLVFFSYFGNCEFHHLIIQKNNFIMNLHGTFQIKLKKVILGSFLVILK